MEGRATRIERREKGVDCVASSKRATARASVELDFIKMSLGFSFSCYYQREEASADGCPEQGVQTPREEEEFF